MEESTCIVGGCEKRRHYAQGWCPMHYQRMKSHGSLDKPPPRAKPTHPACTENGCDAEGNRKGVCEKHYKARWHQANKERSAEKTRARRNADRDAYLARNRAYYEANRGRILAQMADAYAADPRPRILKVHEWRKANPLKRREQTMRRNARKRATQTGPVDYAAILAEHGMFCHICWLVIVDESDLHFDHVIPLARGGAHVAENIRPSHALCNIRKGARAS